MPSKCAATLLIVAVISTASWSQQPTIAPAALPAAVPPGRPVVGLALEGGGALGMAHIGVLHWLEEHQVPVDRLAGTSMGALVGALYAGGSTPAEMRALAESDAFNHVFTLQTPYVDLSYRRRQDSRQVPTIAMLGLKHKPALRNALLTDRGVNEFLSTNMLAYNSRELDYNRMPIPFRCVAADLNTLQTVIFSAGPMPQAVRASLSIPGVFPPVQAVNGHFLVDGGILDNLPTDVLRDELHAETVIAVHLQEAAVATPDTSSVIGVLNRAFDAGIESNVNQALSVANVVINIPISSFSSTDYSKTNAEKLIQVGYRAAEQSRAALLSLALDEQAWKAYVAARDSRRMSPPGNLRQVLVEGSVPAARREVLADFKPLQAQPITAAQTLNALKPIQSNGDLSATYETFAPPPNTAVPNTSNPDTGILVRLTKDPIGPPFLLIGARSGRRNLQHHARRNQPPPGRSESGRLWLRTSRHRPPRLHDRPLHPSTTACSLPADSSSSRAPAFSASRSIIWANQKRVAERFQQNLDAGIEAGRTFGNSMQISAEWRAEDTRWSLTTGSGGGPYLNGTAQTGLLHINIDKETSGTVSPQGFRLSASGGALYHAVASANAPVAMLSTARAWQWKESNIFGLTADINSYLRANVAQPYRFTLGGPRRLSASSFDEYRGTDTYLAHAGYLRRIASLPTGYGQGIYGIIGYEAGETWSPEASAILRQDGTAGVVAATPFGAISFGVSIGDAGHRKVFFTLGHLF